VQTAGLLRHSPPAPQGEPAGARTRRARRIALALLVALLLPLAALAADVEIGQRIELKADKPAGVPLHRAPRPNMIGRAPDRSAAAVIGLEGGGGWLRLSGPNSRSPSSSALR
jgi:hypothetical protein